MCDTRSVQKALARKEHTKPAEKKQITIEGKSFVQGGTNRFEGFADSILQEDDIRRIVIRPHMARHREPVICRGGVKN